MFRIIIIVVTFILTLAPLAMADSLQGRVTEEGNGTGNNNTPSPGTEDDNMRIQRPLQGQAGQNNLSAGDPGLPSMQQQQPPSLFQGQVGSMFSPTQIQAPQTAGVNHSFLPAGANQSLLRGGAQHELSAIGMEFQIQQPHYVLFVDPHSDLYGKVFQGDIVIAIDGIDPQVHRMQRRNFGDENTVVTATIEQHRQIYQYPCYRHPVTWFSNFMRQNLGCP